MVFNSINFLFFFPIVLLVYFIIPKRARYIWLLIASYYFYMSWNAKYAILILFSTVATYVCALLTDKIESKGKRKIVLWTGIIANLSILAFFKYFNFFADNIDFFLMKLGMKQITRFDIILPVGISFYTFQALGYMIDVYRKDIEVEKNFFRYALFVSFFPQLVAGPIEKSKNLLTQINHIEDINVFNFKRIKNGLVLIIYGLFMKMVIADRAAVFVDKIYNNYWAYGSIELILASIVFAVQIYCDFAGYSIIAVGSAKVMGVDLMENFNTPYFASSISDLWRRWHISLNIWFRDYLYFPLGGSRCSKLRNSINILVTFIVSGLWHGANWHYVFWGGIQGMYQVIERNLNPLWKKITQKLEFKVNAPTYTAGAILVTFILNDFLLIFFRAASVSDAFKIIGRIVTRWDPWVLFDKSLYNCGLDMTEIHILLVAVLILTFFDLVKYKSSLSIDAFLEKQVFWFRWLVVWGLMFMILLYGMYGPSYDAASFIYFQF